MRTLKLQVQMTVDGLIADPHGAMDFMTWDWDAALNQTVEALNAPVDCMLLGRKLAEGFIPYWAGVAADPDNPEQASGRQFSDMPKVVFSRTLSAAPWPNTTLAGGDLVATVNALKQQPGGDIITNGGASFVADLIAHDLIDDYYLFVNPVAIGSGLPLFNALAGARQLHLRHAQPFACGIVLLNYVPRRA